MAHEELIAKMSLEEKCALLSGATAFESRENPNKGIPKMLFSDGPHGMRVQGEGANHLGIGGSLPATCFPTAVTVANTWDPALGEELGAALANEAGAQNVNVMLGPGLNIKRDPLCGRNFEYFSEDPYLAGKMAAGYVRGMQSTGLSACPKHFAVNSQETRRQASDSVLDERTLREIYLTGFEIAVTESNPGCIMTSYNLVNGTYANENKHLLKDILHDEWGYTGAVVTDWGGSNDHAAGVAAGSTFEMPAPGLCSVQELIDAVKDGTISEADVDARVEEAIDIALKTDAVLKGLPKEFDIEAHHALARRIASEGIVLLKNGDNGEAPLLPLASGTKVALIGDFAKTPRYQGAGSSLVNSTKLDSLVDLIGESGLDCVGYEQGFERNGGANESLADKACDLAGKTDVVIMCLGLGETAESEGAERLHMRLSPNQTELLSRVRAVNPNVVVLLSCGSAVECDWANNAKAVVWLALGGQAGAGAALDVICGKINPSGKLAETWPIRYEDVPTAGRFPSEEQTSEYREGLFYGYRYFQTAGLPVAYPFGFGLSYTNFEYSNLALGKNEVSFTVYNTGTVEGTEVTQLYVAMPSHTIFRPEQELKGFARVTLAPGAKSKVSIPLDDKAFRYFNVATNKWEVEGGIYELRVGASSADIRLTERVEVQGTGAPNPYEGLDLSAYETGQVKQVSDAQFKALLGKAIPSAKTSLERNTCFRDLKKSRSPILMIVSAVITALVNGSYKKGAPDLNALFIYNMPLRAIAKMAGGMADMKLVDALVREAKGWGLIGIVLALILGFGFKRWGLGILVCILWFVCPLIIAFVANQIKMGSLAKVLKEQEESK